MADATEPQQRDAGHDGFDYSRWLPADFERKLGRKVSEVFLATETCVVYLDEDYDIHWEVNDDYEKFCDGFGKVQTRVAAMEAHPTHYFSRDIFRTFRKLTAEGLIRALDDCDADAANEALDHAARYYNERSAERSRAWLLEAGFVAVAVILLLIVAIRVLHFAYPEIVTQPIADVLLGATMAGLGAFVSMALRLVQFPVAAAAGARLHYLEAYGRMVAVMIAAAFIAIALQSGVLDLGGDERTLGVTLVLCALAGASERLIPHLIKQGEARMGKENQSSSENPAGKKGGT